MGNYNSVIMEKVYVYQYSLTLPLPKLFSTPLKSNKWLVCISHPLPLLLCLIVCQQNNPQNMKHDWQERDGGAQRFFNISTMSFINWILKSWLQRNVPCPVSAAINTLEFWRTAQIQHASFTSDHPETPPPCSLPNQSKLPSFHH